MWQDYIGILPGIAAAVMGVVTLGKQKMSRWHKVLIFSLTMVAIGATGFSQWWTLHQKSAEQAERTTTLERLGALIERGDVLINQIVSNPNKPVPLPEINDWAEKCQTYLQTLGKSYVTRFNTGAGYNSQFWDKMNQDQNLSLNAINLRLIRLQEFSTDFSGNVR